MKQWSWSSFYRWENWNACSKMLREEKVEGGKILLASSLAFVLLDPVVSWYTTDAFTIEGAFMQWMHVLTPAMLLSQMGDGICGSSLPCCILGNGEDLGEMEGQDTVLSPQPQVLGSTLAECGDPTHYRPFELRDSRSHGYIIPFLQEAANLTWKTVG